MNATFAEATTGVAFALTLSKRQCNTLLRLKAHEDRFGKPQYGATFSQIRESGSFNPESPANINIVQGDSLRGLRDRGLVFWFTNHKGEPNGFGGLTRAGELMAEVLLEAGMTIQTTNTLSVLKRLERAA
ncbi:hypothetical protein SAMN05216359_105305 [Roseateles sp. YR242]|uniref:hypothetical protein n=1 Tax=Roseateles sp. YR242 TaxID=1855305 RepID=UPI0008C92629|nr:hypothetical protein [Roseateles sp. YR242]SEL13011.1 hypothetical protein SAMN05216359_105305 [Roseateles sp. YR242]